jgi:hypothetical protein
MINEIKAELEQILFYAQQILRRQAVVTEEGKCAARIEQSVLKLLGREKRKVCPECGHIFRGNGWDGIDAHWRAKHESVMPYAQAWPLLKNGLYRREGVADADAADLFNEEGT